MALQLHFIYNDTTPFNGYILPNFMGIVDPESGDSKVALLEAKANSDPNLHLVYISLMDGFPNPETLKYDSVGEEFVAQESGDTTPEEDFNTEMAALKASMTDLINNTSYDEIDGIIDNAFPSPAHTAGQRNILKKLTTICLHYGKRAVR